MAEERPIQERTLRNVCSTCAGCIHFDKGGALSCSLRIALLAVKKPTDAFDNRACPVLKAFDAMVAADIANKPLTPMDGIADIQAKWLAKVAPAHLSAPADATKETEV